MTGDERLDVGHALLQAIRRRLSRQSTGEHGYAAARRQPVVPVVVEIGASGWRAMEREGGLEVAVGGAVGAAVRSHVTALGIPGQPEVQLRRAADGEEALRLRVHGRLCRQPEQRVAEVLGCLAGSERHSLSEVPTEEMGQSIAALCTAAIHRRPSLLLGPEQLRRYRAALASPPGAGTPRDWPPSEERLRSVLELVIGTGVGVGDMGTVAPLLADGELDAVPAIYVAERIIDQLRAPVVQILLNPRTLRWLTTHEEEPKGAFAKIRERLFAQSGSLFPDFVLAEVEDLPDRTMAFGMNSLSTAAVRLPERRAFQAVVRALESELRAHRGWFGSMSLSTARLQQLELVFPDLVSAVRDRYPTEWLAALWRVLLREEVSTRNLKEILERLLDLGEVGQGGDVVRLAESVAVVARPTVTSLPDPRSVVSYLRQRSNEELHEMFSVPWEGKVTFLGPALESIAKAPEEEDARNPDEEQVDRLLGFVRSTVRDSPSVLAVSAVPLRSVVRDLIEPEFPEVPVVAAQELPVAARSPARHPRRTG